MKNIKSLKDTSFFFIPRNSVTNGQSTPSSWHQKKKILYEPVRRQA